MFTITTARIKVLKHDSEGNCANTPSHRLGASVLCTDIMYGLNNTHSTRCPCKCFIISLRSRKLCKKIMEVDQQIDRSRGLGQGPRYFELLAYVHLIIYIVEW